MNNPLVKRFKLELLQYNKKVNVLSRNITEENLDKLILDTYELNKNLKNNYIVDMGSGNGLLGVTIAILNKNKKIVLVDSKQKKVDFLKNTIKKLKLTNVVVMNIDILNFLLKEKNNDITVITRGFTGKDIFQRILDLKKIKEVFLVTSVKKIKSLQNELKNTKISVYNIPEREVLKILKMENVSRETNRKEM
jgi:16S rRNA (guanine(527)-N(7))-methyltransferase RsmG